MNRSYAKTKLTLLLRDIEEYTADEFRRQMARTISTATGQDVPDDCHTIKAERDALAKEVDAANDRNAELVEDRDALAAQVEALRSAIEPFATGGVCSAIDREDYSIMRERIKDWHGVIEFKKAQDAYNSTPQQCLLDVQAEAGRKGFLEGVLQEHLERISSSYNCTEERADQYAESLRQGGAA